jgi:hypothetical protein
MGGVETPPGPRAENVTLKKDAGPPVREETAPRRLNGHYRPQHRRIDVDMRRRRGQTVPVQGQRRACKHHANVSRMRALVI